MKAFDNNKMKAFDTLFCLLLSVLMFVMSVSAIIEKSGKWSLTFIILSLLSLALGIYIMTRKEK